MVRADTPEDVLFAFTPFSEMTPAFVGRRKELRALSAGFGSGKRLGLIVGDIGVGKTSLAHVFCTEAGELFPGGVTYAYARDDALRERIAQPRGSPGLLVVDEADGLGREATEILEASLSDHPYLNLLVVGRRPPEFSSPDQFVVVVSEFSATESARLLSTRLGRIEGNRASQLYRVVGGNPVALACAAFALHRGEVTWDELMRGVCDFSRPGIVGPDGRGVSAQSGTHTRIVLDVSRTNEEVLRMLRLNPDRWYRLPPRKFEEAVAELLTRLGYRIELTPVSADGGFDMYAAKKDSLGEFLFLVECKRFLPPSKVGVGVVRSLQGVLSDHRATGAAIVTTSFFTAGAKAFEHRFQHQLKLHDYIALQKWLHMLD
jgi:restriction system protein